MTTFEPTMDTQDDYPGAKDHRFIPWLTAATEEANALCASVAQALEDHEEANQLRERKRKARDREIFCRVVAALVCNALYFAADARKSGGKGKDATRGSFHLSLSNRYLGTRYAHPVMSKTLPVIMEGLETCGFLEILGKGHKGYFGPACQTTLRATPALIEKAAAHGVPLNSYAHFGPDHTGEETIVLRDRDHWETEGGGIKRAKDNEYIPYTDTAHTRKLREEMTVINDWFASADLYIDEEAIARGFYLSQRFLKRYFILGSFEYGGRLFGGFWDKMPKKHRHSWITITGEPVGTLDFGQTTVQILYAMAGEAPPEGDCYRIPGYEDHRKGIKRMLVAAPYLDKRPSRHLKETQALFPKKTKVGDVVEAILEAHAPIREYLFTDSRIGHTVQNTESRIMVATLLRIIRETDIPCALPVHDALIVPVSRHQETRDIMRATFKECTGGMDIPVSLEM